MAVRPVLNHPRELPPSAIPSRSPLIGSTALILSLAMSCCDSLPPDGEEAGASGDAAGSPVTVRRRATTTPPGSPSTSPNSGRQSTNQKTESPPDEAELLTRAEELVEKFVRRIEAGDVEGARSTLMDNDDFKGILTEGGYEILVGTRLPHNTKVLRGLIKAAGGTGLEYTWKPGDLTVTRTKNGIFREKKPMLNNSVITLNSGATTIRVDFEQMIFLGGEWKIFGLKV